MNIEIEADFAGFGDGGYFVVPLPSGLVSLMRRYAGLFGIDLYRP